MNKRTLTPLAAGLVLLLGGCVAGPDYRRPATVVSQAYTHVALPDATASAPGPGGGEQRLVLDRDIPAEWWALYRYPALSELVSKALAANPNIEAAQAALRAAQETVYAQQGFFFPTVQAGYAASRTKLAGNLGGNSPGVQGDGSVISTTSGTPASAGGQAPFNAPVIYNFHTAKLTVGYAPDVFGLNRRQVEALQAQADMQRFQLEATFLTLASNVVAAAIQDASLRRQIALVEQTIDASGAALALVQRERRAGMASRLDLAAQENALAQSEQLLPPLRKQFEQNRDLLRLLAGLPQDADIPAFELESFELPQALPLSLPSRLVEQRPDVRAAEAALHSAFAAIGIARANRLPQFTLSADSGGAAAQFSQMFWNSGRFFDLSLGVTQSLFDGGTLRHRELAARELAQQAAAQYRAAVLTAFQNVGDVLHAVYADAQALQRAAQALDTSRQSAELMRQELQHGYLDRLSLIAAEQAQRQAQISVVQARASRLGDAAALFQALGGGWSDPGRGTSH